MRKTKGLKFIIVIRKQNTQQYFEKRLMNAKVHKEPYL
jgi:hypothetical protein